MDDTPVHECVFCKRPFSSVRGLNIHKASCKSKPPFSSNVDNVASASASVASASVGRGSENDLILPPNENIDSGNPEINEATFLWGNKSSLEFTRDLNVIYDKIVFYRQNIFKLPSGSAGKEYIRETTRLIRSWTTKSELKNVAWKCIMIMPCLLLQKPSKDSKSKDHVNALKRRFSLWQNGELLELLRECDTIQKRIKSTLPKNTTEAVSNKIATLMKQGQINAAVKLLTSK